MAEKINKTVFQILVLGGGYSPGKSSLIHRFVTDEFLQLDGRRIETIREINIDGQHIKILLMDTMSSEIYTKMYPSFMRASEGVILAYDITNRSSFDDLESFLPLVEKEAVEKNVMLLGLKQDLIRRRDVPTELAEEFALMYDMKFMEVSSLTGINVNEAFYTLARDIKTRLDNSTTNKWMTKSTPLANERSRNPKVKKIKQRKEIPPSQKKIEKPAINVKDELKLLGLDTVSDFQNIMQLGTYKCFWNRIYLVGQYSVGKSTLAKILVGEELPDERQSTDGLWIYMGRAGVNIEKKEWIFLPRGNTTIDIMTSMLMSLKQQSSRHQTRKTFGQKQYEVLSTPKSVEKEQDNEKESEKSKPDEIHKDEDPNTSESVIQDQSYLEMFNEIKASKTISNSNLKFLIIRAIKEGKYQQKIVPFDLWDFGGQKEFYMTHQLFISSRGIFVLMFNGSHDLQSDVSSLQDPFSKPVVAVYLLHWVNSILTYCRKAKHGFPRIILVATHKDKISKNKIEKQRQKLTESIRHLFQSHKGLQHLEFSPLIFINATDKNDPEIEVLKKRLIQRSFEHPKWGEEMPRAWIPLELQIAEQVSEGKHIISRDQLTQLNASNETMVLSERQLETFLKIQHSLGKLIYFDEINLRNFIIINPVYMVEVLRSLVTEKQFWPKGKYFQDILFSLQQTGTIEIKDIFALWEQESFRHILPYKDFMLDILIHLDIIVPPQTSFSEELSKSHEISRFLIPAMISKSDDTQYLTTRFSSKNTIIMAYRFLEDVIPQALAYRFLVCFVTMWDIKNYTGEQLLFNNMAVAQIDDQHDVLLQFKGKRAIISMIHAKNADSIQPTLASSVQECLTAAIYRISEFYIRLSDDESLIKAETTLQMPFEIEYGVICQRWFKKSICFLPQRYMPHSPNTPWICPHGSPHDVRLLSMWFAEKKHLQRCTDICLGLGRLELQQCPLDIHVRRLADEISPMKCREIAVHLGVSVNTWENLEYQYQHQNPNDLKFMALFKWKEENRHPSFSQLQDAVENCDIDKHILCQVLRDVDPQVDICDDIRQSIPTATVLKYISHHIGDSSMQLGIELGISISDLQQIQHKLKNKLLHQTKEILMRWRKFNAKPTVQNLVKALYRIGKIGCLQYIPFEKNFDAK